LHITFKTYKGSTLAEQPERLKKSKADAYLKVVAASTGLLPAPLIYDEFYLDKDGQMLYLKNGTRVTQLKDSVKYLALKSIGTADYIRIHLFPGYTADQHCGSLYPSPIAPPRTKMALAKIKQTAELAAVESVELADLPQRAADIDTEVKRLYVEDVTKLPVRELLGLNKALQRQRGALTDNLAKLSQIDRDIAQAEQELEGEEATNNPEKKRRIEALLQRLRDARAPCLEAAAANREALRTQFSRIRETTERVLNEDTTLADRLRTLFREQGVTITSILTAFGFIVSTLVLAIQNALGAGGGVKPTPSGGRRWSPAADWIKNQLKALADWLKVLAGKAAAALPGIIGAIISWLLKTAGVASTWLAEHLWSLAIALVAMVTVWLRSRHYRRNR